MSGYIGNQPVPQATQTRDSFTATANQTSFPTSGYTPEFLDVFLNGVKLASTDYTATNGSDVVLAAGASVNDILEVVAYGTFEVLNPTFDGNVTFTGNASFGDNDKAIFGAGSDLQIYHNTTGFTGNIIESATGNLYIRSNSLYFQKADGTENNMFAISDGAVSLAYDNAPKLATTSTGIDVTGTVTSDGMTVDGNLVFPTDTAYASATSIRNNANALIFSGGTSGYYFNRHNNSATDLSIDSSGRVGIGTDSPQRNLQVGEYGTGSSTIAIASATNGYGYLVFGDSVAGDGIYRGAITYDHSDDSMLFNTSASEAMRIDSSGNLLVGTTDSNVANNSGSGNDGVSIQPDSVRIARTDGDMLLLNRLNSDGDIAKFLKNGTTVGTIGAVNDKLVIGTSTNGLALDQSSSVIMPWNPSGKVVRDNAVDLGYATGRFKDAYLSGGIYLGGTAAANKLDDYESGSFTANGNWTANNNKYIKVGDLVTISMDLTGPASGSHSQFNLPFTANRTTAVAIYTTFVGFSGGRTYATAVVSGGVCYLRQNGSGVQFATLNVGAGHVIHFSLSYYTTQ